MKNLQSFLLLFSTIIFTSSLVCQPIDKLSALLAATSKIERLDNALNFQVNSNPKTIYGHLENPLCFVFELTPVGYVVVSAEKSLPPIIAYSFTSNYNDKNSEMNVFIEILRKDLNCRLANLGYLTLKRQEKRRLQWDQLLHNKANDSEKFDQWPSAGTTNTGGWLETNWSQSAPYNGFCPMDPVNNQRSVAGCPSVAIGMIINYYETLNQTEFTDITDDYYHSYSGRNYWVDDDFETIDFLSFPDVNAYFDTILNSYSSNSTLKPSETAALVWACGVAAKQVYTSSISGTFSVNQAYEAFLRFGFNDVILLDENDPTIHEHLAQNMMEGRPALLAVVDPGVAGHNLVTDGYNTEGFYHLNFGWGGSYNGWYLIPDEIPFNLTVFEGVIVDIAFPPINVAVYENNTTDNYLTAYPIPTTDILFINFTIESEVDITLQIMDNTGHICIQKHFSGLTKGKQNISLNLRNNDIGILSPGIYIAKIIIEEKIISRKIIIQ